MIHLLDRSGEILRTFDHPFPGGWQVGEERRYEVEIFQSALGPGLEPGEYGLSAGLYDAAGHRWPVEAAGTTSAGDLRVATVAAVEPPAGFPELYFSVAWMPIEEGADLQILGRRWATGDAVIRVGGITGPGAVWLRIGVPDGAEPGQQLVLAAGAAQARSSISAECSGFEAELAGAGSHTLEIPVTVGGDPPGECEIRISANFELISIENQEKRTVVLENLAWSASR